MGVIIYIVGALVTFFLAPLVVSFLPLNLREELSLVDMTQDERFAFALVTGLLSVAWPIMLPLAVILVLVCIIARPLLRLHTRLTQRFLDKKK